MLTRAGVIPFGGSWRRRAGQERHESRTLTLLLVLAAACVCAAPADAASTRMARETKSESPAAAAAYPSKPIRIIVPFAPGATNDILARMVGQHLNQAFGQPVIVDNRAGAEGLIGTDLAVKAAPDGYTLVIISSAYTMNPVVMKLPYDPLTALTFPARIGRSLLVLVVGPSLPVNSVKDLIAAAHAKPGEIVFSSSGGFLHFATALFTSMSKEKFTIALYKGGYPAMMDVIAGQTQAGFQASPAALPMVKAGKLKALAVGSLTRSELLPDIPTLDESGLKGYECANWYAIATAGRTPRAIVMKLHDEIARYFSSPEVQKQFANMGGVIDLQGPDEMRKIIPEEIAKWTKVAVEAGMPRVDN
jgi:tripartite-type tricarboxylate transporter receptor subunit TctC